MTGSIVDFFPQTDHLNGKYIRLGLVSKIFSGGTPDKGNLDYWEGGDMPWIGSGEVNQSVVRTPTAHITRQAVENSATKLFPKDSLIMALAGQGKTKGTVARMGIDAYGNQSLGCISNYSGESRFLYWWLSSLYREIRNLSSQETRDGLNQSMLGQIPVPLFDLATQRQIADFLDRETARIESLIEKKQRLVALLGEKVRSDIHDLFNLLDAETWRIRHLGKVKNGAGFPVDLQGDASNEIPFFKVKHLAVNGLDQRITASEDTITKETARTLRATVFPTGTIVFAKIGAALLLGRFSMLGNQGCIDNNLAAFVVNKRLVDPDYVLLCFERFEMQLMVQPGAVPSLSTEKFINQSVPLPSLDRQRELVGEVRHAVQRNGRIVQRTLASIHRLKEYRSALITAAVTGQIDAQTYAKSVTPDRRLDAIQEEMGA